MSTLREHPNAVLVGRLLEAFRARDAGAIALLFAESAVWHFPGRRGLLAGDHRGHAGILAFLAQVPAATGGSFQLEPEDVLASETGAVILFRGHGERKGLRLDNPTCLRLRIEGSLIAEVWEFVWDLEHVEAFWSP
jgi:ketosteroid isomerase-like protein